MGIEHLKRWQWVALSVPLGLVGAWAMLEGGPQGLQSQYATMGVEEFEARMLGRARWFGRSEGEALDVRAYPVGEGNYLVTAYLPKGGPERDEGRRWVQKYRAHQFARGGTYVPVSAMKDPAQFRFRFDEKDPSAAQRQRGVTQTGWARVEPGYRSVGAKEATLEFQLRKGPAYAVTVGVAPGSEKMGGAIRLKLNGQSLPALTQDATEPTRWHTTVAAGAVKGEKQVLSVASTGGAVSIGDVQLINPAYTLADFVSDAKKQNAGLDYHYQYAWEPRVAYVGWVLGSLIVIGGIWPSLLKMLVGAGFGPVREETYDLSRFKGGEEKKAEKRAVSEAEQARVTALADEMEKKLLAGAKGARGDGGGGGG